jgi:hypothetical protein
VRNNFIKYRQKVADTLKVSVTSNIFFITNHTVLAYPNAQSPRTYLPNDGKASIAYCDDNMFFDASQIQEKKWQSGLLLQGNYFTQVLHPERINRVWKTALRASFVSKIMSPLTAYMVVENEAQKAILLKKQAQVINGNKNLDLGEEPMRADEPSLWLLLGLLGLLWWRRKLRI